MVRICYIDNRFEKKLSLYPFPTVPMNTIHIDHFGSLQETAQRYKHVLVIVDAFFTWYTVHMVESG